MGLAHDTHTLAQSCADLSPFLGGRVTLQTPPGPPTLCWTALQGPPSQCPCLSISAAPASSGAGISVPPHSAGPAHPGRWHCVHSGKKPGRHPDSFPYPVCPSVLWTKLHFRPPGCFPLEPPIPAHHSRPPTAPAACHTTVASSKPAVITVLLGTTPGHHDLLVL